MKTIVRRISIFILAITLSTVSYAGTTSSDAAAVKNEPLTEKETTRLVSRLTEIDEIDKSDLEREEKKALRKEVKEIKKELKRNNGVYLSTGAVIIIVLILIILL